MAGPRTNFRETGAAPLEARYRKPAGTGGKLVLSTTSLINTVRMAHAAAFPAQCCMLALLAKQHASLRRNGRAWHIRSRH